MISLLVIICLSPHDVWAQKQVSLTEAQNAAVNFINKHAVNKNYSLKQIVNVNTDSKRNNTLLYEVMFDDGWAVLLSGSKATLPILGLYQSMNQSILNTEDIPCGLNVFLKEYKEQILCVFDKDTISLCYETEWNNLQSNDRSDDSILYVVAPLLSSKWGQSNSNDYQSHCYNYYVTETGADYISSHCAAGCVAVAMAQIMNYWKYPVFDATKLSQYDWCYMPDEIFHDNNPNYTTQRNAVARLIRDCGVQVNMDYCIDGGCESSAYDEDARDALVDYFKYHSDAVLLSKNENPLVDHFWTEFLKAYLDLGMPLYYGASDPDIENGGHAFVCDGYTNNELFNFNWGWNGLHDGVFAISNLNPNCNYTQDHAVIINLHPQVTQDPCNYELSLDTYYYYFYTTMGYTTPPPYQNVPYVLPILKSSSVTNTYSQNSWRTIPSGATSEYLAHEEVLLQDGFYAEEGCDFLAYIVPCELCHPDTSNIIIPDTTNTDTTIIIILDVPPVTPYKSLSKTTENNQINSIILYPNPVTGTLHIALLNPGESVKQVVVTNLLGNVVLQQDNLPDGSINTTPLANGMYIARICTADGKTYHAKFVKK